MEERQRQYKVVGIAMFVVASLLLWMRVLVSFISRAIAKTSLAEWAQELLTDLLFTVPLQAGVLFLLVFFIYKKGLKKSGVTAHKIAERFDEGEILLQNSFEVAENENYRSLEQKIELSALHLIKKLFADLENYFENATLQSKGEYWKEPTAEQRTIYKDSTELEKDRIIRAFTERYVIISDKNKGE